MSSSATPTPEYQHPEREKAIRLILKTEERQIQKFLNSVTESPSMVSHALRNSEGTFTAVARKEICVQALGMLGEHPPEKIMAAIAAKGLTAMRQMTRSTSSTVNLLELEEAQAWAWLHDRLLYIPIRTA